MFKIKKKILILSAISVVIIAIIVFLVSHRLTNYKNLDIEKIDTQEDSKNNKIYLSSDEFTICTLEYQNIDNELFAKVSVIEKHFSRFTKRNNILNYDATTWLLSSSHAEQFLYSKDYNIEAIQDVVFSEIYNYMCTWESPQSIIEFPCISKTILLFQCKNPEMDINNTSVPFEFHSTLE